MTRANGGDAQSNPKRQAFRQSLTRLSDRQVVIDLIGALGSEQCRSPGHNLFGATSAHELRYTISTSQSFFTSL